ncbi:MAG: spermidine/putrescine ABC transporter substrate-binding protein [Candidatus Adiutrix sp.]|jgi:spermidine/putrescine transport system substrate-binding protein|nr:spermidine/putrescine ABC transporter substrate-binding protein [Candidatus Adiutrix sp.]
MKKLVTLLMVLALFSLSATALAAGKLTVFIWSEYMDPEIIANFEKKFDVEVRLDYYESNEEMVAKLQSGGLGQYDVIVPSTYIVPTLTQLKLIQPLNHALLPNMKNIDEPFTKMDVDPGNKLTIPYQWGLSGLIVRAPAGVELEASWKLLFDPASEVGSFIMFDTARDAIGSALKYLGYSFNSTDPKQIEEAVRLLAATKKRPAFLGFDGGVAGLNKVMSGIAVVAQVYNGEAVRGQEEDPGTRFVLPKEGVEIWTDLVAIPAQAPNLDAAHAFLNYLLEPEVSAQLATYNRYATPNAAAKAFIPETDLKNPSMYPDAETVSKAEYMEDLGPANRLYDEAWTMIKTQ